MDTINRPPAPDNSSPGDSPAGVAPSPLEPTAPAPPSGRVGYPFDPAPQVLKAEVRAGWLKRIDPAIAVEMIGWGRRRGRRESCWSVKRRLAEDLGVSPRTIQSGWARLTARGWIERVTFADGVDPDDPLNHTGSRIYFNWAEGRQRPARDPAEVPPVRPRRGRPPKLGPGPAQGGGEKDFSPPSSPVGPLVSPPGEKRISPPLEKRVSPKEDSDSKAERRTTLNVVCLSAPEGDRGSPRTAAGPDHRARHAGPITASEKAGVERLIDQLGRPEATPEVSEHFARRLIAATPRNKDEGVTYRKYFRLAEERRLGELAEAILVDNFEKACGVKKGHPGKVFLDGVKKDKQRLATAGVRPRSPSPSPASEAPEAPARPGPSPTPVGPAAPDPEQPGVSDLVRGLRRLGQSFGDGTTAIPTPSPSPTPDPQHPGAAAPAGPVAPAGPLKRSHPERLAEFARLPGGQQKRWKAQVRKSHPGSPLLESAVWVANEALKLYEASRLIPPASAPGPDG